MLLREGGLLGVAGAVPGGIQLRGPPGLHRRANLRLRCASRVWLELGTLRVKDVAALRRELRALDLSAYVAPEAPREIEAISRGGMSESDLLAAAGPIRHGSLRLRSEPGTVVVSLDTTGELLSRRGYRQEGSRAPLRESLAAGLLALAGHAPGEPLWDPLCGSGTIVIEAALLGRRIPPGLGRGFAFETFPSHDPAAFEAEKVAAKREEFAKAPGAILGSDLNAGALGTARRNARRAGVLDDLTLFRHDATQPYATLPPDTLAIANLPYGKRVGGELDLPAFYGSVAKAVRESGAKRAAFLTADPRAVEWLGLEGAEMYSVDNGSIRCQLLVSTRR